MKRLLALVLVGAMSLALFGCGKKDSGSGKNRDEDDKPKATTEEVEEDESGDDAGIGYSQKGEKTAFSVSADIELTQGAWLGFIPVQRDSRTKRKQTNTMSSLRILKTLRRRILKTISSSLIMIPLVHWMTEIT